MLQLRFYSPIATGVPKATLEGNESVLMAFMMLPGAVLHVPLGASSRPLCPAGARKAGDRRAQLANSELAALAGVPRQPAEPDLAPSRRASRSLAFAMLWCTAAIRS